MGKLNPEARDQLVKILMKRKLLSRLKNHLLGNPPESKAMYRFPQLQVLIDHPVEDPLQYLAGGTNYEEAMSLLVNPQTGLPVYLPNNPRAAQVLKTMLDKAFPLEELESEKDLPLHHRIENALDLLLHTKDTILSML